MEPLVLYVDRPGVSPWAMHALVALEEKQLPYELVVVDLPMTEAQRAEVERHGALGKIPLLRHGAAGIGESLAISEYLAETFPAPVHPRIFPADLPPRTRCIDAVRAKRRWFACRASAATCRARSSPSASS
jgi:glutathione S-transferase